MSNKRRHNSRSRSPAGGKYSEDSDDSSKFKKRCTRETQQHRHGKNLSTSYRPSDSSDDEYQTSS